MNEIIIVSSNKESGGGIAVLDVHRAGSAVCTNFKNSISDSHCLCVVGGSSSYSGLGSGNSDYIIASQSKKPVLNVYQWGKPQPHQQCHIQEITTSVACDATGTYLLGGTKKGWIYCWELGTGQLLTSWQAHFKSITKIVFTPCSHFAISCSEDGMARAWELSTVVAHDASVLSTDQSKTKRAAVMAPYRSWSPHTLPVKDMATLGGLHTVRLLTVSLDRTVVLHDMHANKQILRVAFPQPLESLGVSRTGDVAFLGSSGGEVYIFDISAAAAAMTSAHAAGIDGQHGRGVTGGSAISSGSSSSYQTLEGHARAVTAIACSIDSTTLITGSEDGSVRVWDSWTRQCLREMKPMAKAAISGLVLLQRPEMLALTGQKPICAPLEHLKKYSDEAGGVLPPCVFGGYVGLGKSIGGQLGMGVGPLHVDGLGRHGKRRDLVPEPVDVETVNEAEPSIERPPAVAHDEQEDFLAFSTSQLEPPTTLAHSAGSEGQLLEKVQKLEAENRRWQKVAAGLKRKLGQ